MVKTEKEFSEIFAGSCKCDEAAGSFVKELSTHYWTDLTSHLNRYFSNEDRTRITQRAAEELSQNLRGSTPDEAWKNVIRSFVTQGNWGFASQEKKPAVKKTEEQKIFWTFFKYAWILFQAMILVKIAILYFGVRSAENPKEVNSYWVIVVCALSVGSLAFFAYRNRNDNT